MASHQPNVTMLQQASGHAKGGGVPRRSMKLHACAVGQKDGSWIGPSCGSRDRFTRKDQMLGHKVGPLGIACRGRLAVPGVEAARASEWFPR